MELLTSKISRYLFAIPFIIFGILHFMGAGNQQMIDTVPLPGGAIWIYITGLAMLAAGVSFLIGKMDYWAGVGLGALLLIFALTIHLPGLMGGNEASMFSLLKDLALAGGAFMMANGGSKSFS